ncbi:TatD family hydrolase [Nannocystis sp.]|uniref:TatD family hydrolase n=1 Tax=Nannocystis sp. TaxID=1962667 RepID=UPI0024270430|nr:TatD family hydrolase [Nannocystis sp.]MBK7824758.1 TatD family hydrolase [Nannocystis sp.]MBK9752991.1 TatD family hydrolase [Nannocystis sp.]
MELVDIGVNLGHRSFAADREAVIERALKSGVRTMICTGTNVRGSQEALALSGRRPGVLFATAGVHPHDAARCDNTTIAALRSLAARPAVVAIGECGLDFNRDFSPRPVQVEWFRRQVALAKELELPLFLHERDAAAAFLEVLDAERPAPETVVVHCFTGDAPTLQQYLRRGYNIGITGWICDERRGQHLRALVKQIDRTRLLVETDAPFLTPRDLRPKPADGRNEPAFLPHVVHAIAACRGEAAVELAAATTANARRVFPRLGSG